MVRRLIRDCFYLNAVLHIFEQGVNIKGKMLCNSDTISDHGALRAQFGLQGSILLSGQVPAYTSHWKNQARSVLLRRTGSVEQPGNLKDDI